MDNLNKVYIELQQGYVEERNLNISTREKDIIYGLKDNKINFSLDKIKEKQTIVYLGDSVTQGFYSNGELSTKSQGYRNIVDQALKSVNKFEKSYNFAIGGFTVNDVSNILYNNLTINDVNKILHQRKNLNEELKKQYSYDMKINPSFYEVIEKSTVLITSIGYNDILPHMGDIWNMENININFDGLFKTIERVKLQKELIFKQILKINPKIKILELDGYVPHTKMSDDTINIIYSLYKYISKNIVINNIENVKTVHIMKNIQAEHLRCIDNTHDAHPNKNGYEIISNKILRTLNDVVA